MSHGSKDNSQIERFREAARELGADGPDAGEAFDRAMGRLFPPRKPGEPSPHVVDEVKPKGSRRRTKSGQ